MWCIYYYTQFNSKLYYYTQLNRKLTWFDDLDNCPLLIYDGGVRVARAFVSDRVQTYWTEKNQQLLQFALDKGIKVALSDAQQEQLDESQLDESQFKKKNTNGKPTFSVIIILIIVICFNLCLLVNISWILLVFIVYTFLATSILGRN